MLKIKDSKILITYMSNDYYLSALGHGPQGFRKLIPALFHKAKVYLAEAL